MLNYRYKGEKKLYFDNFSSDKCAILGLCKLSSNPLTMPHISSPYSHKLKLENESSKFLTSSPSVFHTRKHTQATPQEGSARTYKRKKTPTWLTDSTVYTVWEEDSQMITEKAELQHRMLVNLQIVHVITTNFKYFEWHSDVHNNNLE